MTVLRPQCAWQNSNNLRLIYNLPLGFSSIMSPKSSQQSRRQVDVKLIKYSNWSICIPTFKVCLKILQESFFFEFFLHPDL